MFANSSLSSAAAATAALFGRSASISVQARLAEPARTFRFGGAFRSPRSTPRKPAGIMQAKREAALRAASRSIIEQPPGVMMIRMRELVPGASEKTAAPDIRRAGKPGLRRVGVAAA